VKQHDIGAWVQLQMQVCSAGCIGFSGVGNDDFEFRIFGASVFNASEQDGVCVGGIAASNKEAVG
jgi:hypothetical protein